MDIYIELCILTINKKLIGLAESTWFLKLKIKRIALQFSSAWIRAGFSQAASLDAVIWSATHK